MEHIGIIKKMNNILIVILMVIIISCNKTNIESENYENRQIKTTCELIDDVRNGNCSEYYENGNIKSESVWKDGKLNGKAVSYYENGNFKTISNWINGMQYGEFLSFNNDGFINEKGQFDLGNPVGFFTYYYYHKIYHIREYVKVDTSYTINQFWNFDPSGNILKDQSDYYSIKTSKGDTLRKGEEFTVYFDIESPIYNKSYILTGDISENYTLRNNIDTIWFDGTQCQITKSFNSVGDNWIRLIIVNYQNKPNSDKIEKERFMYFEKNFLVQ